MICFTQTHALEMIDLNQILIKFTSMPQIASSEEFIFLKDEKLIINQLNNGNAVLDNPVFFDIYSKSFRYEFSGMGASSFLEVRMQESNLIQYYFDDEKSEWFEDLKLSPLKNNGIFSELKCIYPKKEDILSKKLIIGEWKFTKKFEKIPENLNHLKIYNDSEDQLKITFIENSWPSYLYYDLITMDFKFVLSPLLQKNKIKYFNKDTLKVHGLRVNKNVLEYLVYNTERKEWVVIAILSKN